LTVAELALRESVRSINSDHHGWLYAWLRRRPGCPDTAADLAHVTFLRLISLRDALPDVRGPRAYRTTTAKRLLVDRARRARMEDAYLAGLALAAEEGDGYLPSERVLAALEALEQIAEALEGVPPKTQNAFLAVYTDTRSLLDRGPPNVDGVETLGLVPIEANVFQPGDEFDTQVLSAALSLDQRLTERLYLGLSHMTYLYDEKLEEHRGSDYITDSVLRLDYTDRDSAATVHSSSLYLAGGFDTGPASHRLVTGVDHTHREDDGREVGADGVGTFDALNPANFRRVVGSYGLAAPLWSPWGGTLETIGVDLQDQIVWANDPDNPDLCIRGVATSALKASSWRPTAGSPTA
jgi:RNA polymerase sigma-70 factor (ECF subfamily)